MKQVYMTETNESTKKLIKKLIFTSLLSLEEKINFLENIETFSKEDLDQFESVIDDFELSAKVITQRYKQNYISELENIKKELDNNPDIELAVKKIKAGFKKLESYEYPTITE